MQELLEEVRLRRDLLSPGRAQAVREAAKISRLRLAKELGVHEITIYRWERGTSHPRGQSLVDYARVLVALQEVSSS
jgi:DNA-binding transcriptional regulator YiaG